MLARDIDVTPRNRATGKATSMAANRISYFFDLSRPSLVVDNGCSSTIAAPHQAVRALYHGEAEKALLCGAKLILNPNVFIPSSELRFLSPSGRCKTFDAAADGCDRGEATLVPLLKVLEQAICDNDSILAVIKGT